MSGLWCVITSDHYWYRSESNLNSVNIAQVPRVAIVNYTKEGCLTTLQFKFYITFCWSNATGIALLLYRTGYRAANDLEGSVRKNK